ncbi:interleukin-3-like [Apodemus sylvaticus]|uniref:interleukin-3-like n=1 Tax=Apodemus sylvaticus TaxID=10129 RepID=UPI002242537A|nr:interleukin-3-like [Apodemus sylvaticus]
MVLASSTTSTFSTLLLLLLLFHSGLQAPTSMLNCSSIAKEIKEKLPKSKLNDTDQRANLMNVTLRRVNLNKFLESLESFDAKDKIEIGIKCNLQRLKCCLPEPVKGSKLTGVSSENLKDFQEKLRFYVIQLYNLPPVLTSRPPQPTSGCVTSNPGTEEC